MNSNLHPIMKAALMPFMPQPKQPTEDDWLAADRANNANKTEQRDASALAHQIKHEGREVA